MKTTTLLISLCAFALIMTSCNSSKKISNEYAGIEIKDLPCSGEKNESDKKFFRTSQEATSSNLSLSREKALLLAKQRLASLIETDLKSVTDRYVNEREFVNKMEFMQKYENETREVLKIGLKNVSICCEETRVLKDGAYRTFIAIEIPKKDFANTYNDYIRNSEKEDLDHDKEKFERIFKDELGES